MRAQQFLLSYATTVFSEEDLKRMKQQSLSGNLMLADILLMNHEAEEQKHTGGEGANKAKTSLKSGLGSILGLFGDSKAHDKKKEGGKGDMKIMDFDPPTTRSSFSLSSFSMDPSQFSTSQTSSIEYQTRFAFFTHFKSAEDVYRYLVDVGRVLVNERDKIAMLFKRVQQSFADLYFHARLMYQECKDLEALKDFFKARVTYLKQQVTAAQKERDEAERESHIEREQRETYLKKLELSERRCTDAEQELTLIRKRVQDFDDESARYRRRIFNLENEKNEMQGHKNMEIVKLQSTIDDVTKDRDSLRSVILQF